MRVYPQMTQIKPTDHSHCLPPDLLITLIIQYLCIICVHLRHLRIERFGKPKGAEPELRRPPNEPL
ncbi:MAG TPA: hypothetical protein VFV83_10095, partial [Chthoniobacteraceae bacterium]|nr:hypothetical protein [Chthoniobacteraceae bacterium]